MTRSSSQLTSTYEAAASLSEFELTNILIDKMSKNKSYDKADYKNKLYDALVESYNTEKDLFDSYGESAHAEEPSHTVEDSGMQQDQEFVTGDNDEQPADKEGGDLSRRYSTSMTKATTYDLKWIEDLVPNLWSPVQVKYDQHAYLGTSHWGPKRQRFYEYASNMTSSKDVYSRRRIIAVTRLKIMKMYDNGHLEEIEVRRDD
ncbi:hypothetical protein Tco_1202723 [Tanacetum coccineum]